MPWNDVVDLITVSHSKDANVFVNETVRTVYANKKSVMRNEFYQAIANGLKPTVTFEIHSFEYEDEQKLRHDGKDYLIIRTFSKDDDMLELICQAYDDVQTNLARLRDMVEIWKNTFIKNSMDEETPSSERLFIVPAHIEYKGGGSSRIDDVIETINNATVTIQYREGITSDLFIMIDGQRWDIRFIEDPYNRHETLVLTVERVIP